MLLMIAGIALAAVPRSPLPGGAGGARAAIGAAADTTVARADSTAAPADSIAAPAEPTGARADSTAAPAVSRADTTAAPADTTSAGSFASEPPETLRFIPPPGLEPPPAPAAQPAAPPSAGPVTAEEPAKAYGPLPKGVTVPGEQPKERAGFLGLHPAAIIAALIVVHVLVIRVVTR